jgi:Peptidase M15
MFVQRCSRLAAAFDRLRPFVRTPAQNAKATGRSRPAKLSFAALAIGCLLTSFEARAESDGSRDYVAPELLLATARYASVDPATTASLPGPQGTGSASPVIRLPAFPGLEKANIRVWPHARTDCVPHQLKKVLADVAARFGAVTVTSTHRNERRNRLAGGVPDSLHLDCRAIDFRVHGQAKGVMAYLRSRPDVGGLKRYPFGIIHIDDGRRRTW